MFDIFAMLLSSIATFLFPVFASYKALNTADPALLKPWLMYWVVLACGLLVESWFSFILVWIPLYPWARALFLLYLIAPQTQGARMLYEMHLHPFLREHELAIDNFISSAHDRLRSTSLNYIKNLIELLKTQLLGLPPKQQQAPQPTAPMSYAQSLLARFNLPNAGRPSFAAAGTAAGSSTTDFYGLLAHAVATATSSSGSSAPNLVPSSIRGPERASFISAQRERLTFLLSALDKEAARLPSGEAPSSSTSYQSMTTPRAFPSNPAFDVDDSHARGLESPDRQVSTAGLSDLSKSRSETDFEKIDAQEEGIREAKEGRPRADRGASERSGGSWMPWGWGARDQTAGGAGVDDVDARTEGRAEGRSSGFDASH